ncbi:hypothetical protein C0Q70_09353 [Pomacea canaliculata]|uniref:Uncharacterized protein n=1 Tax=Pomacea canaliculata TaxID=400727 RepID=A0A2T7P9J5_POMCA|nr:hypothetical protein C0Q70_09353 [Pomacea canaliculata]
MTGQGGFGRSFAADSRGHGARAPVTRNLGTRAARTPPNMVLPPSACRLPAVRPAFITLAFGALEESREFRPYRIACSRRVHPALLCYDPPPSLQDDNMKMRARFYRLLHFGST